MPEQIIESCICPHFEKSLPAKVKNKWASFSKTEKTHIKKSKKVLTFGKWQVINSGLRVTCWIGDYVSHVEKWEFLFFRSDHTLGKESRISLGWTGHRKDSQGAEKCSSRVTARLSELTEREGVWHCATFFFRDFRREKCSCQNCDTDRCKLILNKNGYFKTCLKNKFTKVFF